MWEITKLISIALADRRDSEELDTKHILKKVELASENYAYS